MHADWIRLMIATARLPLRSDPATLPRVSTEMSLHVLAYNLKRMMSIFGIAGLIEAMDRVQAFFASVYGFLGRCRGPESTGRRWCPTGVDLHLHLRIHKLPQLLSLVDVLTCVFTQPGLLAARYDRTIWGDCCRWRKQHFEWCHA